jgi:hypothetical protein
MPKPSHEALVQLIRSAPALIPGLIWPEEQASARAKSRVTATEFVDLNLAEHRADVVLLMGEKERPEEVLVVEVQTAIDPRKHASWPVYVAGLRARHGCPTTLVVVALDDEVARWAGEAIDLGRGMSWVRPMVVGRAAVPAITNIEEAERTPGLAVLSFMAHIDEAADLEGRAQAALVGLHALDNIDAKVYFDIVIARLGQAGQAILEKLMATTGYEFQSEFAREFISKGKAEGIAEGKVEGKAETLFKLLQLKGLEPSDSQRQRVLSCTDPVQLDTWSGRVLTARSVEDVFAE